MRDLFNRFMTRMDIAISVILDTRKFIHVEITHEEEQALLNQNTGRIRPEVTTNVSEHAWRRLQQMMAAKETPAERLLREIMEDE